MYNARANEIWINRLRKFCFGKKVILVGNSPGIFNDMNGAFIDSFDVVVRFGRGFPTKLIESHVGRKTDVWFTGMLRLSNYPSFKNAKFKVVTLAQKSLYDENDDLLYLKKFLFNDDFQIYRDYFLTGTLDDALVSIKNISNTEKLNVEMRPSQGVLCLDWFVNTIKTQKELHVIGFDFQKMKYVYTYNGRKKTSHSWHIPVAHDNVDHEKNVHLNVNEEAYAKKMIDSGAIILHEHDIEKINKAMMIKLFNRRFGDENNKVSHNW